MRLLTVAVPTAVGTSTRIGVERPQGIVDLTTAYAVYLRRDRGVTAATDLAAAMVPPDMLNLIRNGEVGLDAARHALEFADREFQKGNDLDGPDNAKGVHPAGSVRVLAPVPRPNTIRDFITFRKHIENSSKLMGLTEIPKIWFELPVYYKGNPDMVAGPGDPILWPSYTERLDYELEFGAFIGRPGKNLRAKDATRHMFGYTIFNDVSARDMQGREMSLKLGPAKGKDFENSNVMGPCLVTADELTQPHNLTLTARINGEVWSHGNSSDMQYTFEDMIQHVSQDETVMPGDFFGSGTVGGGCGLELDRWIKVGDVIELEVEGIGILRNTVERAPQNRKS